MKSKPDQTKVFSRTLKFQNLISPILLAAAVLLVTAVLSLQTGHSLASAEAAAGELICPADIISYWTLDENTGTTFADPIQTNNATCTPGNCPTSVDGLVNRALDFSGGDNRLTVPDHDSLDWDNDASFSIELWVKTGQACPSPNERIYIGKYSDSASWWLGCARSSDNADRAAFYLRDSIGNELTLYSPSAIDDNGWHHLVAIRDAAASTNRLYVDGQQVASDNNPNYNGDFANTGDLTIGYNNASSPTGHANAIIDEIALYKRALTAAEISDHYNGGAGKPYCTIAPQIEPIDDQTATVGVPFTYDVEADGVPAPTFTLMTSPVDMAINPTTGVITWTPDATGAFSVIVKASNDAGNDTEDFTIVVASLPVITPIPNQTAVVGQLFTYNVVASGDPAPTFSLTEGPAGMTIDENSGIITWTPTTTDAFDVTVKASNSAGSVTESFTITVADIGFEDDHRLFLPFVIRNP